MSSDESKREDSKKAQAPAPDKSPTLDPTKIDKAAEDEMRKKYGFKKGPPGMAQRKISSTGGKQYFDSGDYNMSDRKDKMEIASHPHARNPRLVAPHLRPRGVPPPNQPKLPGGKSPLAD